MPQKNIFSYLNIHVAAATAFKIDALSDLYVLYLNKTSNAKLWMA